MSHKIDRKTDIPVYVPIKKGLSKISGHTNSREYILNLLEVFVRDTPFKQTDFIDLHEDVQNMDAKKANFASSTIRRELLRMRKDNLILIFEDYGRPQDRYYFWAEGAPELAKKRKKHVDTPSRSYKKEKVDSPKKEKSTSDKGVKNTLVSFARNIFGKIF